MKSKASFSLKDHLFNPEKVTYLANLFEAAYPEFKSQEFIQKVLMDFPNLELKERIAHISDSLAKFLPAQFPDALFIILKSLPQELDPSQTDDDFGDFIFAPLSLFVARYGCEQKYLEQSFNALKEITKRFSAEYAIRFFINKFPAQSLVFLNKCATDKNYHVRRLASEGSRPKLPWAQKINIHHSETLAILDKLFYDRTRFVTRSVANHLNDLAKLEPKLVIQTLKRWQKSNKQSKKEMDYITKHALRTLIKQADKEALKLIGFGVKPDITITNLEAKNRLVKIGESFEFSFTISSKKKQKLLLDYIMQFASSGKTQSQKVFKLKQLELANKEQIRISKKHPMRLMTTRRLYLGKHHIILQINGIKYATIDFELVE